MNGGMGCNYNCYYYRSSFPYYPKVGHCAFRSLFGLIVQDCRLSFSGSEGLGIFNDPKKAYVKPKQLQLRVLDLELRVSRTLPDPGFCGEGLGFRV